MDKKQALAVFLFLGRSSDSSHFYHFHLLCRHSNAWRRQSLTMARKRTHVQAKGNELHVSM